MKSNGQVVSMPSRRLIIAALMGIYLAPALASRYAVGHA
jgi:hypothetical protein